MDHDRRPGRAEERSFPVRVRLKSRSGELGPQLAMMRAWLDHHGGPGTYHLEPAGEAGDLNAHFLDVHVAAAFVDRFVCGWKVLPARVLRAASSGEAKARIEA